MSTSSTMHAPSGSLDGSPLYTGLLLMVFLSFVALIYGFLLFQVDPQLFTERPMMSTLMFKDQDVSWYALVLVLTLALVLAWRRAASITAVDHLVGSPIWHRIGIPSIAVAVLVLASVGTFVTNLGFGHSADEYLAVLQAAIFAEGQLLARPAQEWREMVDALYPVFIYHDADHDLIAGTYRPVYAAILALLDFAGLRSVTNAVFAASSILLVGAVSRQLWPGRNDLALLAAVLLASSPQVLFTGMSGFAWPAHLCLNLAWLWLFLRGGLRGHALAATVGFLATGLHQVHPHILFVMPFMLGLLFDRRWRLAAVYATTYGAAVFLWMFWHDVAVGLTVSGGLDPASAKSGREYLTIVLALLDPFNPTTYILIAQNLLRLLAWQNPILLPLIVVAFAYAARLTPTLRRLAWGLALSMVPYLLVMPNQYFALGYRYFHGLQGNMVLLAVFGWMILSERGAFDGEYRWAKRGLALFTAATLFVGLPLRAWQANDFIAPMYKSLHHIETRPSDIVLVDVADIWFGRDLVRNDPFLENRPIVLALQLLNENQIRRICAEYDVEVIGHDDLAAFGSRPVDRYDDPDLDRSLSNRERLALAHGPACAGR